MARKILINALSAKIGGGKTYISNLMQRMPSGDFEVLIYLPDEIDPPNDTRIKKLRTAWPTRNPILRSLWERFILPIILRRQKIELLFCPGGAQATSPSKHYKIVTMFRNMLPFDSRIPFSSKSLREKVRDILLKRIMLKTMTNADVVIFISHYARQVIEGTAQIKKAVTIPHGISEQFYAGKRILARPPLSFSGEYFLYVSRFEFYKRHLEVIQAYQLLPSEIKSRYKLVLAGEADLPAGAAAIDYVKKNNLTESIIFLGKYPYGDLPSLYKNASLFIFASTCENCPNILLEAMGTGVQILCSNYDPMPEFGGSAVNYMNPDSPADISEKISLALSQTIDAEVIQQQAQQFEWAETARKTWDLLLTI